MPIYKTDKKRDGLYIYTVRVNYTDKNGKAHGLTRTAVGAEAAKLLESQLTAEYKTGQITPAERMTVGELAGGVPRFQAIRSTPRFHREGCADHKPLHPADSAERKA